jgi:type IV pilus assembly protein PilM
MAKMTVGKVSATRVAVSLPVAKVFTRVLELPSMKPEDLGQAVRLEAEQYIPVPLPDLYIDYEVIEMGPDHNEVLMVAAPRAIVDSYIKLFDFMNLEVAVIESGQRPPLVPSWQRQPSINRRWVADIGSAP